MSELTGRKSISIISPLRYPGAKRRLGVYVAEVLRINNLKPKLFVEPFAGSLSVSLQLLQKGLVEKIGIGEKDPLVASFWKIAFHQTEWLKKEIRKVPVTLEKWHYFRKTEFKSDRERAVACLFLNRTSFSGILASSAGPIGGQAQTSNYPIGCRFNLSTIDKRLDKLALLRNKVEFINTKNWKATLDKAAKSGYEEKEIFYYLDPPFYYKANKLYRYFFNENDHQQLHDVIIAEKSPWLLSYDNAEEILVKYEGNGTSPKKIGFLYSAATETIRSETEELIITNLPNLPTETRFWRRKTDRRKSR